MKLFELITLKKHLAGIDGVNIPEATIRSKFRRGNLSNVKRGQTSPMADVELILVYLLKCTSRMGEHVSQRQCIKMANKLIKGTSYGKKLADWKLKYVPYCKQQFKVNKRYYPTEKVEWGWFSGFQGRYKEVTL